MQPCPSERLPSLSRIQKSYISNSTLNAKYRAEQYTDFYASGDKLFCKCCQRTVDWTRKDTCDKQRASQSTSVLQTTINSSTKAERNDPSSNASAPCV